MKRKVRDKEMIKPLSQVCRHDRMNMFRVILQKDDANPQLQVALGTYTKEPVQQPNLIPYGPKLEWLTEVTKDSWKHNQQRLKDTSHYKRCGD